MRVVTDVIRLGGACGKCVAEDGAVCWISYGTVVGFRPVDDSMAYFTSEKYSRTTTKHVKLTLRPDAASAWDVVTVAPETFAALVEFHGYSAARGAAPAQFA